MQSWEARHSIRRSQFLEKTRMRLQEVTALLDKLAQQPRDEESLLLLNKHFHQMAGAGGIYELTELCNLAMAAEEICVKLVQNKAPVGSLEQDKLRSQCAELLKDVHQELKKAPHTVAVEGDLQEHEMESSGQGKPSILLVDQNAERLVAWQRLFEENGMCVRSVKSASGAKGAFLTRLPDAVIISAPLSDSVHGFEVIKQMREMAGGQHIITILIDDAANFKVKIAAVKFGADSFLPGPADVNDILLKTREFLSKKQPQQFKVLSVEDDPDQAMFIKHTLESAGYSVMHIANAVEFESSLNSFAPDLVLLDIMLGDISGHDLARYVRKHEKFGKLPIIFLSTENQLNSHVESARVGGDDHLVKPIAPQLLVATIAGKLERDS